MATSYAASQCAVRGLLTWLTSYGTVNTWVPDQITHFKSSLVKSVRESLHCDHYFTLPLTPWINGKVEAVCRELLQCLKALLSEFKLSSIAWPDNVPVMQLAINSAPTKMLKEKTPLEVFLGRQCDVLVLVLLPHDGGFKIGALSWDEQDRSWKVRERERHCRICTGRWRRVQMDDEVRRLELTNLKNGARFARHTFEMLSISHLDGNILVAINMMPSKAQYLRNYDESL